MEDKNISNFFKIIGGILVAWGILDLIMYYVAQIDIYWSWFGIDLYAINDFLGTFIPMIFIVVGGIIFGMGNKED